MAERRHELLAAVERVVAEHVAAFGIAADVAAHVGASAADMLAEEWAGQQLTFPRNASYGLSPREVEIYQRRRDGAAVWQLARDYGYTERGIRKLLQRVELRLENDPDQGDLFTSGTPKR